MLKLALNVRNDNVHGDNKKTVFALEAKKNITKGNHSSMF